MGAGKAGRFLVLVLIALLCACTSKDRAKGVPIVSGAPSPSGGSTGGSAGSSSGGGTTPAVVATVDTPSAGASGNVNVTFTLADPQGARSDVVVEVSADGGATYWAATAGNGGAGTQGLLPGVRHLFVWDSLADLGPTFQDRMRVRVEPRGGTAGESASFSVKNDSLQVPVRLTRYPYLQDASQSSMTVVWKTDHPVLGAVWYGPTPALGQVAQGASPTDFHVVEVSSLRAGSTYYYRVLGDGGFLTPVERWKTHKDRSQDDFTFWAFGDCGYPSTGQGALAGMMRDREADFAIILGDVVYTFGAWWEFDPNFFQPFRDILKNTLIYPALGNHDIITLLGQPYLDNFVLPTNNPSGSERYYSFEWGNALFIALDSSTSVIVPGTGQHRFLLDELLKPNRPTWTFVYLHHPPYSSGVHGSDKAIRWVLSPLFEDNGVDVVFTGHDHHYERTNVMRDYNPNGRGVTYVVSGAAAKLRNDGQSSFTAAHASEFCVLRLHVQGTHLDAEALRPDGSALDSWSIQK